MAAVHAASRASILSMEIVKARAREVIMPTTLSESPLRCGSPPVVEVAHSQLSDKKVCTLLLSTPFSLSQCNLRIKGVSQYPSNVSKQRRIAVSRSSADFVADGIAATDVLVPSSVACCEVPRTMCAVPCLSCTRSRAMVPPMAEMLVAPFLAACSAAARGVSLLFGWLLLVVCR